MKEKVMHAVFLIAALTSILAVVLICVFLFANGLPAIAEIGPKNFLLGKNWMPTAGNPQFGIFPIDPQAVRRTWPVDPCGRDSARHDDSADHHRRGGVGFARCTSTLL